VCTACESPDGRVRERLEDQARQCGDGTGRRGSLGWCIGENPALRSNKTVRWQSVQAKCQRGELIRFMLRPVSVVSSGGMRPQSGGKGCCSFISW
jgi:hypothetical protein